MLFRDLFTRNVCVCVNVKVSLVAFRHNCSVVPFILWYSGYSYEGHGTFRSESQTSNYGNNIKLLNLGRPSRLYSPVLNLHILYQFSLKCINFMQSANLINGHFWEVTPLCIVVFQCIYYTGFLLFL